MNPCTLLYLTESVDDMHRPDDQQSTSAAPLLADNVPGGVAGPVLSATTTLRSSARKTLATSLLLLCQSEVPQGKCLTHEDTEFVFASRGQ